MRPKYIMIHVAINDVLSRRAKTRTMQVPISRQQIQLIEFIEESI